MIDWNGQVVLVTGAASGIGRALAQALHGRGATVVSADLNHDGAKQTAALTGGEALHADMANGDAAGDLVAAVLARHGRLDAVFSNAGMGYGRRLLKADLDDPALLRMWEVNTLSAVRFAQAWVPALERGGTRGRLVITGSENSLSLPPSIQNVGNGLYAASKHGVLILAEWLATETRNAGKPLDVHVILPGGVYTGMTAAGLGPDPDKWPAEMGIILPDAAAEIAIRGLDLGLFYIPTHAHLIDDMGARYRGVAAATQALGLAKG